MSTAIRTTALPSTLASQEQAPGDTSYGNAGSCAALRGVMESHENDPVFDPSLGLKVSEYASDIYRSLISCEPVEDMTTTVDPSTLWEVGPRVSVRYRALVESLLTQDTDTDCNSLLAFARIVDGIVVVMTHDCSD